MYIMSIQVPLGQPVEKHLQYLGCLKYERVTIYKTLYLGPVDKSYCFPNNLLAETRKQTQSVEVFERRRERRSSHLALTFIAPNMPMLGLMCFHGNWNTGAVRLRRDLPSISFYLHRLDERTDDRK